jgi:uncharacterized protein YqhQ
MEKHWSFEINPFLKIFIFRWLDLTNRYFMMYLHGCLVIPYRVVYDNALKLVKENQVPYSHLHIKFGCNHMFITIICTEINEVI